MTRRVLLIGASVALAALCSCAPPIRIEPIERDGSDAGEPIDTGRADEVEATAPMAPKADVKSTAPPKADVKSTAPPKADPPHEIGDEQIWHIGQFEATSDDELAAEKAFYAKLRDAWLGRDEVRAFDLLTEEMVLRPAHRELRILRAAVTLSGLDAGTLPLRVLGGEPGESSNVFVETLFFVIAEFQRGIPEQPPAMVPWTGLYHPHLYSRLIGSYVSLWSHGLRPLIRNQALMAGEIDVFEDFDPVNPSLVESILTAQVLAARGDVAKARKVLNIQFEEQVAREYVLRWRALVRALDASLEALAVMPARDARSLLLTWEEQVTELIPEAQGTLLVLPLAALERLALRREGILIRGPAIWSVPDLRAILVLAAHERSGAPVGEDVRAEHAELVDSFLAMAYRLRDFRADSLVRLRSGRAEGILSEGLVHDSGLRFVEDGRRRAAFDGVDGVNVAEEDDGWVVPCGGATFVWIAR